MSKFVGGDEEAEIVIRSLKSSSATDANPWVRLSLTPPYVLDEDKEAVQKFNRKRKQDSVHFLHIDEILPEPWIGDLKSPVLLLSNNPGFDGTDKVRQQQRVLEWMRCNLNQVPLEFPFYYLNPSYEPDWWRAKLRCLTKHFATQGGDGCKVVARSILNVVFFPYPSSRFGHLRLNLPSDAQRYSFDIVKEAVKRNAVIIHMRKPDRKCPELRDIWADQVPGLRTYDRRFRVENYMNPQINDNLRDFQGRRRGFQETIDAIQAYLPVPERPSTKPGSKEAVLKHFGVFKDDADLQKQLVGIRTRREGVEE